MNSRKPILLGLVGLSQALGTLLFLALVVGYTKYTGTEGWPILFPALICALAAEAGMLLVALRRPKSLGGAAKLAGQILASWLIGMSGFVALESYLPFKTVLLAWTASVLALYWLLREA